MFYWLISHDFDGIGAFLSIGPKHNTAAEAKEWLRENATTEGDYALVCLTVVAKPRVVVELEGLDDDDDGTRKRRKRVTADTVLEPAPAPVAPAVGTVAPPVRPALAVVRNAEPESIVIPAETIVAIVKDALLQNGNLTEAQIMRHIAGAGVTHGADIRASLIAASNALFDSKIERWDSQPGPAIYKIVLDPADDTQTEPELEPEPETLPETADPADIGTELLDNVMRAPEPATVLQNGTTVEAFNGVDWRYCKYATQGTADKVANKVRAAIESGNPDAYATATSTFQPGRAPVEK